MTCKSGGFYTVQYTPAAGYIFYEWIREGNIMCYPYNANPTTCRIESDPERYGLAGKEFDVTKVTPAGQREKLAAKLADRPEVDFAPRSVFAWEIAAARED